MLDNNTEEYERQFHDYVETLINLIKKEINTNLKIAKNKSGKKLSNSDIDFLRRTIAHSYFSVYMAALCHIYRTYFSEDLLCEQFALYLEYQKEQKKTKKSPSPWAI